MVRTCSIFIVKLHEKKIIPGKDKIELMMSRNPQCKNASMNMNRKHLPSLFLLPFFAASVVTKEALLFLGRFCITK